MNLLKTIQTRFKNEWLTQFVKKNKIKRWAAVDWNRNPAAFLKNQLIFPQLSSSLFVAIVSLTKWEVKWSSNDGVLSVRNKKEKNGEWRWERTENYKK